MQKKGFLRNFNMIYYALISLLIVNFTACSGDSRTKKPDPYTERVGNLIPFLQKHKVPISKSTDAYLLQADKCNLCNISDIDSIFKKQQNSSNDLLFIFTSNKNSSLNQYLSQKIQQKQFLLYCDSLNEMSKIGLSFMRNLHLHIENEKLVNWKFL
jgi:hypothetical protein